MLSIRFQPDVDDDDPGTATGLLTLGSYLESFLSSLTFWSRSEYEHHWREACVRVAAGEASSALVTDMYDPATANFIRWWPFYRQGDTLRFHNQVLFLAELKKPADVGDLFSLVPPYAAVNEDGQPISEWSVPFRDLEVWLDGVGSR